MILASAVCEVWFKSTLQEAHPSSFRRGEVVGWVLESEVSCWEGRHVWTRKKKKKEAHPKSNTWSGPDMFWACGLKSQDILLKWNN